MKPLSYTAKKRLAGKPLKPKKVNLGKKGKFTIKKPGAFSLKAHKAGMSTAAYAQKMKSAGGVTGNQAKAAIGLLAMHHK